VKIGENGYSRCDMNQMWIMLEICLRINNQCHFLHVA
jgi:hypothetical protein